MLLGVILLFLFLAVAVVVVFFLCWAPFHAQRLLVIYVKKDQWTQELLSLQHALYYLSGVLYYVSSVINPILYSIMSLKFRQAFRNICRPQCRCQKDTNSTHRRQTLRQKTFRFTPRQQQEPDDSKLALSSLQRQLRQQSRFPASPMTPQDGVVDACSNKRSSGGSSSTGRHFANGLKMPLVRQSSCQSCAGTACVGHGAVGKNSASLSDNNESCCMAALQVELQSVSYCRPIHQPYFSYHSSRSAAASNSFFSRPYHSYA